MITLQTGYTLQGLAGTASDITYTVTGGDSYNSSTSVNSFEVLGQGQLGTSAATMLTTSPVPSSTVYLINGIHLSNTSATAIPITLYVVPSGSAAATNQLISFTIPANGSAVYGNDGWDVLSSSGQLLTVTTSSGSGAISGWIDVTQQSTPVLATNSSSTNVTNLNTILSNAPNGSTIYFPGNSSAYAFNSAITVPAKMFTFQGQGSNRAGSPATAYTMLSFGTAVSGFITLTNDYWYTTFNNICFLATTAQTSGAAVTTGGNVGINFTNCSFQATSATQTWYNCINYTSANDANSTVIQSCNFGGFTNYGININSSGASMNIVDTIIQGVYGTATQVAAACIVATQAGALQIDNCDILGAVNNLLLNPTTGLVVASVFAVNTYFDNASGSCILINGAGATVRTKFVECSMTCSSSGAGSYSAIQVAGSFVYTAAAAQGLDIIGCNILNTFGATGTTNGIVCTNAADITIKANRIAGWTNGIQVTPITSVTQLMIEGNFIGSNGGYGVNTVGILLNAGTYLSQNICDNSLLNNTTAITDSTTVTTTANNNRIIMGNIGYNPKSTVAQPTVPATTVAVWNSTGVNCTVYVKDATIANLTVITVGGVAVTTEPATAASALPIPVAANQQIAMTFTTAPTWTWVGS